MSASSSLVEDPPFPVHLGGGGMDLPAMRATFTGKTIAFDMLQRPIPVSQWMK